MSRSNETSIVTVIALGLACFSTGFSVTASAYGNIARGAAPEPEPSFAADTSRVSERACSRPATEARADRAR